VPGDGADLRLALCSGGWPATSVRATGLNGPATMLFVAVPTFRKDDVLDIVRSTAPDAYWSLRTAPAYHGLPAPEPEPTHRRGVMTQSRKGAERPGG
jgi:hypothetical protein